MYSAKIDSRAIGRIDANSGDITPFCPILFSANRTPHINEFLQVSGQLQSPYLNI